MNLPIASETTNFFESTNNLLFSLGVFQTTTPFSVILISLAILLVFFALSRIISYIFKKYISKLVAKTPSTFNSLFVVFLSNHLPSFVLLGGLYFSILYFTSYFLQEYISFILSIVFLIFVFLVLRTLADLVSILLSKLCEFSKDRLKKGKNQTLVCDKTLSVYSKSISNFVMFVVFFLIVLSVYGIDVSIFLASLGILGLATSLAAGAIISDFISGIVLLIDRSFVVGDHIKAGDKEGQVLKIGLMFTKMITKNNEEITLPNSLITSSSIVNYKKTRSPVGVRFEINVNVAHNSDVDIVKNTLLKLANKTEKVFKNPKPIARLLGVSGSSLNFSLLFWCLYTDQHSLRDELYSKIVSEFKKHKIEIK
ncbi:MAG: hypothetical protein COW47_01865 [Candidatus Huberarchaeum crystalense]|uniref:Mechanosensitive ion channel protein MscS n=1 Tax=Huberarchaeum crystalense TaxID=2014257 RepID=A0A2G9LJS1_HUBC1|nr:mechanosensitive ion channel family protein [archaeon]OIP20743.1 MAG: hypothetical protein AUJ91_00525 [archaeon CG2_30_31_98]PIN66796.1 MAG: hypothetical protein COW69_00175 [Candidatus Huberarchaeum crystalense]NCS98309.1 mechanosensitive ion channel family protein [archaeon]PIV13948.1 MAG: hypothetical protein COS45_00130 [Candidatus Huberarchaeum crystalense]